MSKGDGYAGQAVAFTMKDGKLQRARVKEAQSIGELLEITRNHFGTERALALMPQSDRLPKP